MEEIIIQIVLQAVFLLYPVWRIYGRAGLVQPLSLTVLIPWIGILVAALVLVFSKWNFQAEGGS
jgi:hypothetical protein